MQPSYWRQLWDMLPSILLSAGMAAVVGMVLLLKLGDLPTLLIQIPLGVLVYVLGSVLFRLESFRFLWDLIQKYRQRKGAQA